MNIPSSFNNSISSVFYDKTFTIYTAEDIVDDEGWARQEVTEGESFSGNISFARVDEIKQEYGLTEDLFATITTDEEIANGTILMYGSKMMRVVRAIKFDSHYLLLCEDWSSKSSISPSA